MKTIKLGLLLLGFIVPAVSEPAVGLSARELLRGSGAEQASSGWRNLFPAWASNRGRSVCAIAQD